MILRKQWTRFLNFIDYVSNAGSVKYSLYNSLNKVRRVSLRRYWGLNKIQRLRERQAISLSPVHLRFDGSVCSAGPQDLFLNSVQLKI